MTKLTIALLAMMGLATGALAQSPPQPGCMTISDVASRLPEIPEYKNPRRVSADKTTLAIRLYLSAGGQAGSWNKAWLMDHQSGGGVIAVGTNRHICGVALFQNQGMWKAILEQIEGVRS